MRKIKEQIRDFWLSRYYYVRWLMSGKEHFAVASALYTKQGRAALAEAMIEPFRGTLNGDIN